MAWSTLAAIAILVAVVMALAKGIEVRLVLLVAAFALAAITRQAEQVVIAFFQGLADAASIIPICSAMGFAYVIKAFGCDQELVKALARPLLTVRLLAVPGAICIGFLVNIPIISQTSTLLAVGTVLIPLLRSMGLPAVVIASTLVLGSSIGGELLNPGAPELGTIADKLAHGPWQITRIELTSHMFRLLLLHLVITLLVYLWLRRGELRQQEPMPIPAENIHWLKAIVPVVPIVLLFVLGPPLKLYEWPQHWLIGERDLPALYSSRLIGLSMLIGCIVACLVCPRQAGGVARHFFEGAGYGYFHIISLIVIAKCFSVGINLSGFAETLGEGAKLWPVMLLPMATLLPALLAFLSGSGIGATQGLYPLLAKIALDQGVSPIDVGVLCCIGSAAGRTASVVAAVSLMGAQLNEVKTADISKRVMLPLACGLAVIVAVMMIKHALR